MKQDTRRAGGLATVIFGALVCVLLGGCAMSARQQQFLENPDKYNDDPAAYDMLR